MSGGPPPKPPPKPGASLPGRAPPAKPLAPPARRELPSASAVADVQETPTPPEPVRSATHSRMRSPEEHDEPTSDIIPLLSIPPPGRDVDKYIGCTIDGRYVVQSVLGEGGMGVVYRCRRRVFEKTVAVKILRSDMAKSSEATERFMTEAKAASAIGNDHIVDVFDFGELPDGSTYFAMEYLEGPTVADLIETGELVGSRRVLSIGRQLAEGLLAAHRGGIVHRDLKPDNIFVIDREGREFVKIVDFGIAKVAGLGNKLTRAGAIFGTPHYMSPEQARGKPVDHRTDVYSLGIILYEMIAGQPPFDADNPLSILSMHLHDPPLPPSALDDPPEVPPGLERVILKCLAKTPTDRFESMKELGDALAAIERGDSVDEIVVPISVVPPRESPVPLSQLQPNLDAQPESQVPAAPALPSFEVPVDPAPARVSLPEAGPSSARSDRLSRLELAVESALEDAKVAEEWQAAQARARWPYLLLGVVVLGAAGVAFALLGPGRSVAMLGEPVQAARPLIAKEHPGLGAATTAQKKTIPVALVLSPIDARVFRGSADLGRMPVTVDVPVGETLVVYVRRDGYYPRKVTLDGSKSRQQVRLAPILGGRAPAPDETGSETEEGSPAPPAKPAASAPSPAPPQPDVEE